MQDRQKIIHIANLFLYLSILWLFLSGHYTPLLLGLGLGSVILVTKISLRMNLMVFHQREVLMHVIKFIPYCFWLFIEIIKSNIDVCKRILNPTLPINPDVINIKASQRTDLATVTYANSITLTPGTVSIDVRGSIIEVHALSESGIKSLETGEMDKRISESEK